MVAWGIYLFKMSCCLTVFYVLYFLFFKNNTFFKVNRLYLLSGLLFSFIIPLLNLSIFTTSTIIPIDYISANTFIKPAETASAIQITNTVASTPYYVSINSFSGPASAFYSSSIKKRILMMTRKKTSFAFSGLYLVAIPMICLLLMAFSIRPSSAISTPSLTSIGDTTKFTPTDHTPDISPVDTKKVKGIRLYGGLLNWVTNKMEHTGVNFEMADDSEIIATADGIVVESNFDAERGNHIVINHGGIYSTQYSHLKIQIVKAGDTIKKGMVIGFGDSTGSAITRPQMQYEVLKFGKVVDPKGC